MGHSVLPTDVAVNIDEVAVDPALTPRSLESAQAFTRTLAHSHYENFSVVSLLLPRHLRQDFCNIYAFCRVADDLGDESPDKETAATRLREMRAATRACYDGRVESPVFIALQGTIKRHDIPAEPFLDLIDAFEQDQRITRYDSFEQVRDYCRRSADPVGRLVLYLCGYRDAERQRLSDATCTALQLTNFWQDVRRDLLNLDRIYIPAETLRKFGADEALLIDCIKNDRCDAKLQEVIRFECDRAEALFDEGAALLPMLDRSVRGQIALFAEGGRAILKAIRRQDFDTITRRPTLSKVGKAKLIFSALVGRLFARGGAA